MSLSEGGRNSWSHIHWSHALKTSGMARYAELWNRMCVAGRAGRLPAGAAAGLAEGGPEGAQPRAGLRQPQGGHSPSWTIAMYTSPLCSFQPFGSLSRCSFATSVDQMWEHKLSPAVFGASECMFVVVSCARLRWHTCMRACPFCGSESHGLKSLGSEAKWIYHSNGSASAGEPGVGAAGRGAPL